MANCHCFCSSYHVESKNEVISFENMNQTYMIFLIPFLLQLVSYFLKTFIVKSYHDLSFLYPSPTRKQACKASQESAYAGLTIELTPTAVNVEKAHAETVVTTVKKMLNTQHKILRMLHMVQLRRKVYKFR